MTNETSQGIPTKMNGCLIPLVIGNKEMTEAKAYLPRPTNAVRKDPLFRWGPMAR